MYENFCLCEQSGKLPENKATIEADGVQKRRPLITVTR